MQILRWVVLGFLIGGTTVTYLWVPTKQSEPNKLGLRQTDQEPTRFNLSVTPEIIAAKISEQGDREEAIEKLTALKKDANLDDLFRNFNYATIMKNKYWYLIYFSDSEPTIKEGPKTETSFNGPVLTFQIRDKGSYMEYSKRGNTIGLSVRLVKTIKTSDFRTRIS